MCLTVKGPSNLLHGLSCDVKPKENLCRTENQQPIQVPEIIDQNSTEAVNKGIPAASFDFSPAPESEGNHSDKKLLAHVGGAVTTSITAAVFSATEKFPEFVALVTRSKPGEVGRVMNNLE